MSSEGPYGRQGFQSNPSGYGSSAGGGGSNYTQQPVYGYGAGSVPGGGGYGAPPPPPSSGGYDYNNPYGSNVDVSSEVSFVATKTHPRRPTNFFAVMISFLSLFLYFSNADSIMCDYLAIFFNVQTPL